MPFFSPFIPIVIFSIFFPYQWCQSFCYTKRTGILTTTSNHIFIVRSRPLLLLYESESPDDKSDETKQSAQVKKPKRTSGRKKVSKDISSTSSIEEEEEDSTTEAEPATKRLVWKPVGRIPNKGIPITLIDSHVNKREFPYGSVMEDLDDTSASEEEDDVEISSFDQVFSQTEVDAEVMERQRQKTEDEIYNQYEYYQPSAKDFDDDGVEILSSPIFGGYNPIDERAIVTPMESYMVAEHSRNDSSLANLYPDEEAEFQEEVKQIRKDMKKLDTFVDPYLQLDVPRNVRPWHGTVQDDKITYEPKDFSNNRFTKPEDKTDFTKLDPYTARKTAVRMALMDNNEWLPKGVTEEYFKKKSKWFRENNVLFGTLQKGECDPEIVELIQPVLRTLGNVVKLLSIQEPGVFRFHYFGPMKHRRGMQSWTKMMIHELGGVNCTGIVFETGLRVVDERDTLFREFNCYGTPTQWKTVTSPDDPSVLSNYM